MSLGSLSLSSFRFSKAGLLGIGLILASANTQVAANVVLNGGFVTSANWNVSGTASIETSPTRDTDNDDWYLRLASDNAASPTTGVSSTRL